MGYLQDIADRGKANAVIVNKFGESTNVDAEATDIHDQADSGTDLEIWVAPTAARVHAIVSTDATDITGLGTLTLAANAADTETVTIGTKVYTWQDTLTDVDGNVHIGANASASIDNLIAAINLSGGTPGTDYATSMTANTGFSAGVGAGDTMRLYDDLSTAGATTETMAQGSWGGAVTVSGTGARTIRIYGLKTWASAETSEDINLRGDTSQNTANSYVIIHRIKVLTKGATSVNAGAITATAATDSTVTAKINIGNGQTQMAIYGIPTGYSFYMHQYYASMIKNAAATELSIKLLVNPEPDSEEITFLTKHVNGLDSTGTNYMKHTFNPAYKIAGPAIIKIQGNAGAADTNVSAGFDGVVVNESLANTLH